MIDRVLLLSLAASLLGCGVRDDSERETRAQRGQLAMRDAAARQHFLRHTRWDGAVNFFSTEVDFALFASFADHAASACVIGQVPAPGTVTGSCRTWTCAAGDTAAQSRSAGTIRVRGTATPVVATPGPDNRYELVGDAAAFHGGEHLEISVQGAAPIPHLEHSTFAAPTAVMTTAWQSTLDRTKSLDIGWTFGAGLRAGARMEVVIGSFDGSKAIECVFPLAAGHGAVPAAVLATLPQTGGGYLLTQSATYTLKQLPDGSTMIFHVGNQTDNSFAEVLF